MSTPSLEQCQLLPQLQRVASRSDQSSGTAQGNPEPCSSSGRPQRSSTERCLCRAHSWSSTWPCPHSAAVQGSRGTAQPARPSPAPRGSRTAPGCARRGGPGRAGQGRAGPRQGSAAGPRHGRGNASCAAPRLQPARRGEKAGEEKRRPCPPSQQSSPTKEAPASSREAPHAQRARRAAPAQRAFRARCRPGRCRWVPGGDRGRAGVPVLGRGSRRRLRPPPPPLSPRTLRRALAAHRGVYSARPQGRLTSPRSVRRGGVSAAAPPAGRALTGRQGARAGTACPREGSAQTPSRFYFFFFLFFFVFSIPSAGR